MVWDKKGNPPPKSPGRPKGARNRIDYAPVNALAEHMHSVNAAGVSNVVAALRILHAENPAKYLDVCASLCPKEQILDADITVRTIVTGVPRRDEEAVEAEAVKALPASETGVRVIEQRHPGVTHLDSHKEPAQGLDPEEKKQTPVDYPSLEGWR